MVYKSTYYLYKINIYLKLSITNMEKYIFSIYHLSYNSDFDNFTYNYHQYQDINLDLNILCKCYLFCKFSKLYCILYIMKRLLKDIIHVNITIIIDRRIIIFIMILIFQVSKIYNWCLIFHNHHSYLSIFSIIHFYYNSHMDI